MSVSEPAHELPGDGPEIPDDLAEAITAARRGDVIHVTIGSKSFDIVVSELPEAPEFFRRGAREMARRLDAEDAVEADESWDDPGDDTPWEQVKAELGI